MKKLLSLLLITLSLSATAAPFRSDSLYSKWIIDSRMGDFRNKDKTEGFKTQSAQRVHSSWDYVSGLVAKGILKAWEQYKDSTWSAYWFDGVQDYADNIDMKLGESNVDDLNAGKIFFELYRGAVAKNQKEKAETYKKNATICRNKLKNEHQRIEKPLCGAGGFWHKDKYVNQMWLDGLYMGAALYAEWQGNFDVKDKKSWNDIALQFDTIFAHTWDNEKELCYHAFSAEPNNEASVAWADQKTGRSKEFWARGMGWFFAALVDVLEYMPKNLPAYVRLQSYTNQVAAGLAKRQDEKTGCWYQLLQYDDSKTSSCGINNYIESSASSMFTYAYLKGIRLGLFTEDYRAVAQKAYRGLIENFIVEEPNGKIKIIQSCESAGLSSSRIGDADYYLCGKDVMINNNSEGKALGPFIMASIEFERAATAKTKTIATETILTVKKSNRKSNRKVSTH